MFFAMETRGNPDDELITVFLKQEEKTEASRTVQAYIVGTMRTW